MFPNHECHFYSLWEVRLWCFLLRLWTAIDCNKLLSLQKHLSLLRWVELVSDPWTSLSTESHNCHLSIWCSLANNFRQGMKGYNLKHLHEPASCQENANCNNWGNTHAHILNVSTWMNLSMYLHHKYWEWSYSVLMILVDLKAIETWLNSIGL
jgi:hypothetical protein